MTEVVSHLNDVDIAKVASLAAKIQQQPEVAQTKWSAEVKWKGGFRSEARIREFVPVISDEPAGLGGTDAGPNPVEQLLGALGNCLAVGYAANATAAGIKLRDITIKLDGDIDLHTFIGLRDGHAGFSKITAKVKLDTDASPEELKALHEKVNNSSPVGHTLSQAVPLIVDLV